MTRRTWVLVLAAAAACGSEPAGPVVVDVAAQPCETPNRRRGRGVVVDDGLVVTAAHTVEGPLRTLTVDGEAAVVTALDERTDLAVLSAPATDGASELATGTIVAAGVVDGAEVRITSTGPLVVNDATAGVSHEREVHRFEPGVDAGASGAPLLDADERVLGVVVLDRDDDGGAYAVTADEVAALLGAEQAAVRHVVGCSG